MGSHLSSVTAKPSIQPPRIVIHGKGGVGKTELAISAPNVLLMPLEEGLGKRQAAHLPKPESYEDVMNMMAELANEEHDYKSLAIDTIDHLEPLIWQKVCEEGGSKYKNIEDFGYGKGYIKADPYWVDFFKRADALRRRGMTIIVLCHNEDRNVDDPMVGSYTRTMPKLHKRAVALLYEWADIVGYLDLERFASDVGKEGKRETRTARTTQDRVLYLEDQGAFVAKNRYDLPPQINIPKDNPYGALRAELVKALGVKKEAA